VLSNRSVPPTAHNESMNGDPSLFALANEVSSWLAMGQPVTLARVIDTTGFSSRDAAGAVAFSPDHGLTGRIMAGAADRALVALMSPDRTAAGPLITSLTVADSDAENVGLSCGGTVRLLLQPASDIDDAGWNRLAAGQPSCLVTELDAADGPAGSQRASSTTVHSPESLAAAALGPNIERIFARGASATAIVTVAGRRSVVTALWPVPTLVVVGEGLIADALVAVADLLGWRSTVSNDVEESSSLAATLRTGDGLVVLSHDLTIAGPVLRAGIASPMSYLGALGSRHTQSTRKDWLLANGVDHTGIAKIHGPAGLDIGALTPEEIALSITAEMLAARTGREGAALRNSTGSIHGAGLNAPPLRHSIS
jgi:xanthine dehydrogenase accessory factor